MNFLELLDEYNKDTKITKENIQSKLYDIPVLVGKYQKYLYQWRRQFIKVESEKNELFRKKYHHYKYDYNKTLDSKEIKWHIETDEEFSKIESRYQILKSEVDQIQEMIKHCMNLSFFCRNIIEWEQFMNGE